MLFYFLLAAADEDATLITTAVPLTLHIGAENLETYLKQLERQKRTVESLTLHLGKTLTSSQRIDIFKVLFSMPRLAILDLSDNHITDEEVKYLSGELEHNTTLTMLNLYHNNVKDEGMISLAKMLETNTKLATLNLYYNSHFMSHAEAIAFARMLEKNTTLTTLIWGSNFREDDFLGINFKKEGEAIILKALQQNTGLTKLDLSYNHISGDSITSLIEALKINKTLTSLNFNSDHIENQAVPLAKVLETNKTLKRLKIHEYFTDRGTKDLLNMLKVNTTLTEFSLHPRLQESGTIIALRDMLKVNKTLTTLVIWERGMMKILVEALYENSTLTELDLGNNWLGGEEIADLTEMLRTHHSLKILNMRGNQIHLKETIALARALETNTTLNVLDLSKNMIKSEGAVMLLANSSLCVLKLSDNDINNADVIILADGLKKNKTLRELDLSYNPISYDGFVALAEAIKENQRLEVLNLRPTSLEFELTIPEISVFLETLKINRSLKELRLSRYHDYTFDKRVLFSQMAQLLDGNKLIAESKFKRNITIIMRADRSTTTQLPADIWGNVAEYLGYPESFVKEHLIYELDEMKKSHRSFQKLKQRCHQKILTLGIRSSKMGRGNTEEDLNAISNESSETHQRLRALYDKKPSNVKEGFSFHHWLKMQRSFYNSAARNQYPKPSFEKWLQTKE